MASLVALSLSNRHARVSVCYEEHLSRPDVSSVKLHFHDMVIGCEAYISSLSASIGSELTSAPCS